jgi:hypothetical protein
MATTLQKLSAFVTRGTYAIDAKVGNALRYMMQRGAADNVAYNPTAASPAAVISTLQAIPALQLVNACGFNGDNAVVGGRTYRFRAVLPCTVNGTSGINLTWDGGSATFASFNATGFNYVGSTLTIVNTTAAGTGTANAAAAYTTMLVEGSFVASGSGSFGPRYATNTGTATAPIIAAGAYVTLTEIPYLEVP